MPGLFSAGTSENAVPASPALNVCNGNGHWCVLESLLLLAAGGSIVEGGILLLQGVYCCLEGPQH